jgi:tetratricopeptide (TPR) repeat protein
MILAVWACAAQTLPMSPAAIEAALLADLRGNAASLPGAEMRGRPDRPTGQSVSVARLRHRTPKEARKALDRAEKQSRAGAHEMAAKELEKAVARDPEFFEAHGNLGVEYAQLGRLQDAAAELKRAIALDASSSNSYYNLGLVYFQAGDVLQAERNARRALQASGSDHQARAFLEFLQSGRQNCAIHQIEREEATK